MEVSGQIKGGWKGPKAGPDISEKEKNLFSLVAFELWLVQPLA